jgi:hypothetical protein
VVFQGQDPLQGAGEASVIGLPPGSWQSLAYGNINPVFLWCSCDVPIPVFKLLLIRAPVTLDWGPSHANTTSSSLKYLHVQ